jgi:hypothetical protein
MIKELHAAAFACSALVSIHASVAGAADVSGPSLVPASAFYIGFGATGNYNKYNDWNVDATGYSNVYQGGELVQSGTAGGPPVDLGSGLIDHIQKMTRAAIAMADMKVWAQRS